MDLTKKYKDEEGNHRNILEMVNMCPKWAANRIQQGKRIAELEAQLAEMTSERDSESQWAKEYHDRAKELEARLAEIVLWLERYQPDVFKRGLWDALNA